MPMKCMLQMPVPIASEPASHQMRATCVSVERTRFARSSVTYDAKLAISTEVSTTHGS